MKKFSWIYLLSALMIGYIFQTIQITIFEARIADIVTASSLANFCFYGIPLLGAIVGCLIVHYTDTNNYRRLSLVSIIGLVLSLVFHAFSHTDYFVIISSTLTLLFSTILTVLTIIAFSYRLGRIELSNDDKLKHSLFFFIGYFLGKALYKFIDFLMNFLFPNSFQLYIGWLFPSFLAMLFCIIYIFISKKILIFDERYSKSEHHYYSTTLNTAIIIIVFTLMNIVYYYTNFDDYVSDANDIYSMFSFIGAVIILAILTKVIKASNVKSVVIIGISSSILIAIIMSICNFVLTIDTAVLVVINFTGVLVSNSLYIAFIFSMSYAMFMVFLRHNRLSTGICFLTISFMFGNFISQFVDSMNHFAFLYIFDFTSLMFLVFFVKSYKQSTVAQPEIATPAARNDDAVVDKGTGVTNQGTGTVVEGKE